MRRVPQIAALAGLSLSLMGSATPRRTHTLPDDEAILARFEEMVSVDLACARLAVEHGQSKEVRDFAAMLVREHEMARQMARDIAAQIHLRPKPSSNPPGQAEHERIVKELRGRPDIAFDVLFVRHEIEYHKALLNAINTEWLPAAQHADLSALFGQVVPAFETHSRMAQELAQRLGPRK